MSSKDKNFLVNRLDYDSISLGERQKEEMDKFFKKFGKKNISDELVQLLNANTRKGYYHTKPRKYNWDTGKPTYSASDFQEDAKGLREKNIDGYTSNFGKYKRSAEHLLFLAQSGEFINVWNNYLRDKSETSNNIDDYNLYKIWQKIVGLKNMNYTKLFTIFLDKYEFIKENYNGENYKELLFDSVNHLKNIFRRYSIHTDSKVIASLFSSFYHVIDHFEYEKMQDMEEIMGSKENNKYLSDIARNYSIDEEGNILPPYGYHFKL